MGNMSSNNPLNKHVLDIDMNGSVNNYALLRHSADGPIYPDHKIHIHEMDFRSSGAAVIRFNIGNQVIFERTMTAAGEFHIVDKDFFTNQTQAHFTISISNAINVKGQIRYSLQ